MNSLSKLGLAAVFALGASSVSIAQDAGVDTGGDADLDIGAGSEMAVDVDPMATGSISTHGNLVSSIQTSSDFDLSAYNDQATVNCVTVSSLQGDAQGNAQAIGNATASNPAIITLRSDIQANTNLMTDLETSCDVAEFDVQNIVFVETGADGSLTFYYDDRGAGADVAANASGGANAATDVDVDPMATGSINTHGNLVSSIQTTSEFDLSAYNAMTSVNCVLVSSLDGDAQGNAMAIGNAAADNEAIASLRTEIDARPNLVGDIESDCGVDNFDVQDIVYLETGADGSLTFYYDDSAA